VEGSFVATKVSVIVPVYNPGAYLERCLESLSRQSLPPAEVELIFVDDGSTDDTPQRLARYAEEHPQARVITIPNSGWPGKPRNVGTDAAAGEYVMFVDQDDELEPEALERMHTLGSANGADVVLGKVISDFRGVHHNLYREQRPRCTVFTAGLMNSLTPHKMLRTAFLREQGIRYPEGPRRLEDQLFMTQAYFAAESASIVADYVCYRYLKRPDGKNAGSKRIDPPGYYGNLREVLDVVDGATEPGEQRNGFYRRFLRTEMLGRLRGPQVLKIPADYLMVLHRELRTLLEERFPVEVEQGLGVALRGQAALLRFGTIYEIAEQARAVDSVKAAARLTGLRQVDGRTVEIGVEGRLLVGDEPLLLESSEHGWLLPRSLTGPGLRDDERRIEDLAEMSGDVVIQHRVTLDEWFVPGPLVARIDPHGDRGELVWWGTATVDPLTTAGGAPLRKGLHDFTIRLQGLGLTRNKRLGADRSPGLARLPLLVDSADRINQVYDTDLGNLSLNRDAKEHWVQTALRTAPFVDTDDGSVVLDLGTVWADPPTVVLTLTPAEGTPVEWTMAPESPGSTRWVAAPTLDRLRMKLGDYSARLSVPGRPEPVELDAGWTLDATRRRLWMSDTVRLAGRRAADGSRRVLRKVLPHP
jgi:glycosyltransferase involved in cell wall biosynthesis